VAAPEGVDDDHAATAAWAWWPVVLRRSGGFGRGAGFRFGHVEEFASPGEAGLAGGAGEQAVVADAMEDLGQDREQEAPDELGRRQGHGR
jgi:hypothetical protein